MSDRVLRGEVESLRIAVETLRLRVGELEERVEEAESGSRRSGPEASGSSFGDSTWGVVSRSSVLEEPAEIPRAVGGQRYPGGGEIDPTSHEQRAELARGCGRFLRRCLDGVNRGSSGRDRLSLQNRGYVILADHSGALLPEARYVTSFAEVKSVCKVGQDCGRSIFLGFATQWEARLALETAGVPLPVKLRNV